MVHIINKNIFGKYVAHICPLPSGVLTQALLQHIDQCMRHEDAVQNIMLAQLAHTAC